MHTKRIIPCLDVNAGRVVKGVNFVNLIDAGDPVECALAYDKAGADELVFLDITASSDARDTVVDMVRAVAESVFLLQSWTRRLFQELRTSSVRNVSWLPSMPKEELTEPDGTYSKTAAESIWELTRSNGQSKPVNSARVRFF